MGLAGTRRALLAAIIVVAPTYALDAHADGSAGKEVSVRNVEKARELARKSTEAYRRGDFREAISLLDEAYELDPQPVLLFNRARAEEGLGNTDAAIAGYERFLEEEPTARDRGAIEQRLVTLRRQRDERIAFEKSRSARSQEPAREQAPSQRPHESSSPSFLPYVVAGVGAAALATGGLFGAMALSTRDDAVAEPVQQKAIELKGDASSLATMSTVSFIVGGILVATGAAWWFYDGTRSRQRASVPLRVGLGPGGVHVGGVLP